MNRGTGTTDRRPWRNSIALAAAVALILTPGTTFGAEEGGGHSGGGGGGMGGGGEDTSPGNNLSMPVIWTDTGPSPDPQGANHAADSDPGDTRGRWRHHIVRPERHRDLCPEG